MKINVIRAMVILVPIAVIGGMIFLRYFYFDERGQQAKLTAQIDCAQVLPSDLEIQGIRTTVPREQACGLMKAIGSMKEVQEKPEDADSADPWHYFGRMRVKLTRDVWFIVFRARKSEGYQPRFALRHWKGSGWTVIGDFDAGEALRMLGVRDKIDRGKLESADALKPTDQGEEM